MQKSKFVLPFLFLPLLACTETPETRDIRTHIRKEAKLVQKPQPIPVLPAPSLAAAYDPTGKRDPFDDYFQDGPELPPGVGLTALQLDKLQLVGTIVGGATPMAMFRGPEGKGYSAKIGSAIGTNFGLIRSIARSKVVIEESYRDFTGQRVPVKKVLAINETR